MLFLLSMASLLRNLQLTPMCLTILCCLFIARHHRILPPPTSLLCLHCPWLPLRRVLHPLCLYSAKQLSTLVRSPAFRNVNPLSKDTRPRTSMSDRTVVTAPDRRRDGDPKHSIARAGLQSIARAIPALLTLRHVIVSAWSKMLSTSTLPRQAPRQARQDAPPPRSQPCFRPVRAGVISRSGRGSGYRTGSHRLRHGRLRLRLRLRDPSLPDELRLRPRLFDDSSSRRSSSNGQGWHK